MNALHPQDRRSDSGISGFIQQDRRDVREFEMAKLIWPYRVLLLLIVALGITLGLLDIKAAWTLRPDGSSLTTGKMPVFDFMNLWAGGKLALEGQLDVLFDQGRYLKWLHDNISMNIGGSEWSYPPSMLLLGAPLSLLSLNAAYSVWTVATLALFGWAMRRAQIDGLFIAIAVLSPAALVNITFGQNGALTAALLAGGLLVSQSRPWLAGILLGLLTTKPHLGLLVPLCLLATGNWRAIAAAALTTFALALFTAIAFGWEAWILFFRQTQPMMQAIMEAPWPQGYQANGITIFLLMRYLGADVALAYAVQIGAAIICMAAAFVLWRCERIHIVDKTALTLILTLLATPYAYTYDMVGFSGALALLAWRHGRPALLLMCAVWLWPVLQRALISSGTAGPVAPFVIAGTFVLACIVVLRSARLQPELGATRHP